MNGLFANVLLYLPIILRFRQLFASKYDAKYFIYMQMEEKVMEIFIILLIIFSRRKLIIFFSNFESGAKLHLEMKQILNFVT